jgi:TnpA family transposase
MTGERDPQKQLWNYQVKFTPMSRIVFAPFHIKVINANVRDATHVLDGLLYRESDLRIEEHYTDTAGFTDHVFAMMSLLGFRFAPRISDLADKRLYVPGKDQRFPALAGLIGGTINSKLIAAQWQEVLRLATSIRQGTVTASLILRKLGSYPRQNSLAAALREIGRIERTLFTLEWLQSPDLRRRVQVGLFELPIAGVLHPFQNGPQH